MIQELFIGCHEWSCVTARAFRSGTLPGGRRQQLLVAHNTSFDFDPSRVTGRCAFIIFDMFVGSRAKFGVVGATPLTARGRGIARLGPNRG